MTVDLTYAGRKYGFLTVAYSTQLGLNVACRCTCSKLVHVARADLIAGIVTSCGCQPAPAAFHTHHAELKAQQAREILFRVATTRRGA